MELFLEFLGEQWILASAVAVMIMLLLQHESRKGGQSVTPQQLSDLINKEEGMVLDIRDSKDFKDGHIVNAKNITVAGLEKHMSELNSHKQKPIIVVCKMGQTATGITKRLKAEGFESVYKLSGGIMEWKASNFPLVK